MKEINNGNAEDSKAPVREKQLAVRVTAEEFDAFKNKAKREGKLPSQVLLDFISAYIEQPVEAGIEERVRGLEEKIQLLEQNLGKQVA